MPSDPNIKGTPIGKDMPGALKGDYNKERTGISPNYQGRCKNAVPGYVGENAIQPRDFAQGKMQAGRGKKE